MATPKIGENCRYVQNDPHKCKIKLEKFHFDILSRFGVIKESPPGGRNPPPSGEIGLNTLYNVSSVPCGAQYRGGIQYRGGYHDACGGYLEYRGGYHDKCGGYLEYCGDTHYRGGYHNACGVFSTIEATIFCCLSTPWY